MTHDRRRRKVAALEHLEPRLLLASYVVNSPLAAPDGDLNNPAADTGNPGSPSGITTLQSVADQAAHDNVSATITFTDNFTIVAGVTFTVPVTITGPATIDGNLTAPAGSTLVGLTINGKLTLGNGSTVRNSNLVDGLSAGNTATVENNIIGRVSAGGVALALGNNGILSGNQIHASAEASPNSEIGNNCTVANNQFDAISFGSGNTLNNNSFTSFVHVSGSNNQILNNTLNSPGAIGIFVVFGNQNSITGNSISAAVTGIQLFFADQTTIANNVITASEREGILSTSSSRSLITGNFIGIRPNGQVAGNGGHGISLAQSNDNTIGGTAAPSRNVISGNLSDGIHVEDCSVLQILGNYIGTGLTGLSAVPNGGDGLYVAATVASGDALVTVGGATAGSGNVISGNGKLGIEIIGSKVVIQGNSIGVGATNATKVGNALSGIKLTGNDNTVGGTAAAARNVIGGNGVSVASSPFRAGIDIVDGSRNVIQGNSLGTNAAGTLDLGNVGAGIRLSGTSAQNSIGGSVSGAGNTIAKNGLNQAVGTIMIGAGGVVISGQNSNRNTIRRNSIFGNGGRGIVLGTFLQALNDPGSYTTDALGNRQLIKLPDTDAGPNTLQNYPVISSIDSTGGNLHIKGSLQSAPSSTFMLEFFANSQPNHTGFGDGQTFLGQTQVTTDSFGYASFDATFASAGGGKFIAATATDSAGNTSGFSLVDTDFDGLADAWETVGAIESGKNGIDVNEDGVIDLALPGANPMRKTIFVELDTMAGNGVLVDARSGNQSSIQLVQNAFAQSPLSNPDGTTGIDLIVQTDETGLPAVQFTGTGLSASFDAFKTAHFGTTAERANPLAIQVKKLVYRYAVFAQSLPGGVSGLAEIQGNDFVIAAPDDPSSPFAALNQAGTFMHELGHTLGLHTGGGGSDPFGGGDDVPFKPNYFSVMNFAWQIPGMAALQYAQVYDLKNLLSSLYNNQSLTGPVLAQVQKYFQSWTLDYSRVTLPDLNEASLLESAGIGGNANVTVPVGPKSAVNGTPTLFAPIQFVPQGGPVDWNRSGTAGDTALAIAADINDLMKGVLSTTPSQLLKGHSDWSALNLNFLDYGQGVEDGAHYHVETNQIPSVLDPSASVADLEVSQLSLTATPAVGQPFTLQLTVTNKGPNTAAAVVLTDTLPTNVTFVSATPSQGTFSLNGNVLTFTLGSLAPSATATITLVIRPNASGTNQIVAHVASTTTDPIAANNDNSLPVVVPALPVRATSARTAMVKFGKKKEKVILITFNGALNSATAAKVGLYRLAAAGKDKKFGTKDDKPTKLKAASFDSKSNTITIRTKVALNLAQPLQLKITGLTDSLGRPIDGNLNGLIGGDLIAMVSKTGVVVKRG